MDLQSSFFWILFFIGLNLYQFADASAAVEAWIVLLVMSVIFTLSHEPLAFFTFLVLTIVIYVIANKIKTANLKIGKMMLTIGISASISTLFLSKLGLVPISFGLSFFSFQVIGYLIDVYRRDLEPEKNISLLFTSFVAFFSISAGPILRTADIIPQLTKPRRLSFQDARTGLLRICWGLSKKAIGDMLGLEVDRYFASQLHGGTVYASIALIALAGQYYADFSGYSDVAIGTGILLGIKIPENFRTPYFATSVADHWRRWHISLCDWFRIYLFTPLSLARWPNWFPTVFSNSRFRTVLSLIATMITIGLWHGLTINNLIWSTYNAVLIILTVHFAPLAGAREWPGKKSFLIASTFFSWRSEVC